MADNNDHRIKRVAKEEPEEKVFKLVKIGSSADYEPPSFKEKTGMMPKADSRIYCNCHSVCGCDSVDCNTCGCHDVCACDSVCTCDSHQSSSGSLCTCNTVDVCTCNAVCTCNSHCTCNSQHYWYPN